MTGTITLCPLGRGVRLLEMPVSGGSIAPYSPRPSHRKEVLKGDRGSTFIAPLVIHLGGNNRLIIRDLFSSGLVAQLAESSGDLSYPGVVGHFFSVNL